MFFSKTFTVKSLTENKKSTFIKPFTVNSNRVKYDVGFIHYFLIRVICCFIQYEVVVSILFRTNSSVIKILKLGKSTVFESAIEHHTIVHRCIG